MKKVVLLIVAFMLMASCSTTKNEQDMVLSSNGLTKYHIVVSTDASDEEKYAAQLLQEYIYKISGSKVPVVNKCKKIHNEEIHIGNTAESKIGSVEDDSIRVIRKGSSLYFNAKDGNGVMYAVFDFMEKYLGVRIFTKDQDYYPTDSNLTIKNISSYSFKPVNNFRSVNSTFLRQDKNLKRWLRANTTEDMFANGYFVHTILKLCSPKEYFDSHPEYFAIVNGKRDRGQICWTNDDVFEIVKKNLSKSMYLQPNKQVWSVSQEDNDIVCSCDKCKKLIEENKSNAAPVIYFVNKIAKAFPDKTISTLAYRFSRKCPENMTLENNVQIMLCSIEVDRNKTIEEQSNGSSSFAYDLEQWGKLTKNIFLWDYECDFDYYVSPFPNLHVLQPNIQFFVRNNAFDHFQQANCDTGHEFSELKNYLIAKLLWDPYINVDSTITEFCDNYYGKAGKLIKTYINETEQEAIKEKGNVRLDIYGSPVALKDNILRKENLDKWSKLFDKAESLVKNDSTYLLRVKTCRLPLQYAIMEIAKTDMYGTNGWFENIDNKWVVKQNMSQMLEDFHNICTQIEVKDINEKGLTHEEYYKVTKRMINSDLSTNLAFHKNVTASIDPNKEYSKGELSVLTDGVRGGDDYKMLWIGWWGKDVVLDLDLEQITNDKKITISTLCKSASWILHPFSIECKVSKDNKEWKSLGEINGDGYNRNSPVIKEFSFDSQDSFRYVKFIITATKTLPDWHYCYTYDSWVFLDEIVVQ